MVESARCWEVQGWWDGGGDPWCEGAGPWCRRPPAWWCVCLARVGGNLDKKDEIEKRKERKKERCICDPPPRNES